MVYLKRSNFGKFWPIARKGTAYVAKSNHNVNESMPLIVIIRDVLGFVKNKKELKKIINEKQIKINGKEIKEINYPVCLFDVLSLGNLKKSYRVILSEKKKYELEEVSEKESKSRPYKILNKKIVGGNKVQLNLTAGKNIISKEKANIGDTIVLDFENKILEIVSIKKGANAMVIKGKHIGNKGIIEDVIERGGKKLVKLKLEKEKINVWIKNVIAIK